MRQLSIRSTTTPTPSPAAPLTAATPYRPPRCSQGSSAHGPPGSPRWRRTHGPSRWCRRWGSSGPGQRRESRRNRRHNAANASANSKTSMSAARRPALAMAFCIASWPAVSISTGSTRGRAATMRARGVSPERWPARRRQDEQARRRRPSAARCPPCADVDRRRSGSWRHERVLSCAQMRRRLAAARPAPRRRARADQLVVGRMPVAPGSATTAAVERPCAHAAAALVGSPTP